MALYAADALTTNKPWKLWEFKRPGFDEWVGCGHNPTWTIDNEYRRRTKQHTIVLTTGQLREVILACDYPSWDGEDFKSGVLALEAALGIPTKTNAQIACDMLGQAHNALEEHSAEICEPNVDHIQRMVWDAMQLLAKGDVK
jgi:hypothetical protein